MTENNWVVILMYQSEAILAFNGVYITSVYKDNYSEMDILKTAANSLARMFNIELQTIETDALVGEIEDGESGAVIEAVIEVGAHI